MSVQDAEYNPWWLPAAILTLGILVVAALAPAEAESTTMQSSPRLLIMGNNGTCSLSSGKTFRFKGTGFTPGGDVMVIIRYPLESDRAGGFYFYHNNYGLYRANAKGIIRSKPWDCLDGPGGSVDPVGTYPVTAIDFETNRTAPKTRFRVTRK